MTNDNSIKLIETAFFFLESSASSSDTDSKYDQVALVASFFLTVCLSAKTSMPVHLAALRMLRRARDHLKLPLANVLSTALVENSLSGILTRWVDVASVCLEDCADGSTSPELVSSVCKRIADIWATLAEKSLYEKSSTGKISYNTLVSLTKIVNVEQICECADNPAATARGWIETLVDFPPLGKAGWGLDTREILVELAKKGEGQAEWSSRLKSNLKILSQHALQSVNKLM